MNYISITFYMFIVVALILFYAMPSKHRWKILLGANLFFYSYVGNRTLLIFIITIIFSWGAGLCIDKIENSLVKSRIKKIVLFGSIFIVISPLFLVKYSDFALSLIGKKLNLSLVVPIGISYYSLQMISYLVDISRRNIEPEKNLFKYALYISYFPQILQGPIARYPQMKSQLQQEYEFNETTFVKGIHLIIWGFFLKMMIADKSAIVVNEIFNNYEMYVGWYVILGGVLYSIQLYTDFLACITISQGVSLLFGIEIVDNFNHPYSAVSVKEFWHRWHISLSTWLRDYVYIPLGGNRKGKLIKYCNLMITFIISGVWHGAGFKYIVWGMMHAFYQIVEDVIMPVKKYIWENTILYKIEEIRKCCEQLVTFVCVMLAWIVFRADSLRGAIAMLKNIVKVNNVWIFFDGSMTRLGLSLKQIVVLIISIGIMYIVSKYQQRVSVRDYILRQNILVRWGIYIGSVVVILIFGTYGNGFDAQSFIYGGF